ncbi:MAG: phenylacetate--CoA ligase family protein [Desulfitobacteriaceae bacterium]
MTEARLQELMAHASTHSAFWYERLKDKGFQDVPILKKSDLPEIQQNDPQFGGLLTIPEHEVVRIFMSPGPIYDPQCREQDFWRFAEALAVAGFGVGDIVQNTFSYHLSPAGIMFDSALRKLGATVIPAGVGNTDLQVQVLRHCRVTGFVGTPSFLATLLEKANEMGYKLGKELNLVKAFFTAEKVSSSLKEQWQAQGLSVFEGYGTADAGCIAYEDSLHQGLKVASTCYVELCVPGTGGPIVEGEIGEVVVTPFENKYPLIRFGTGDLSAWVPGKEGKYLQGVLGRVGDGIKVRGMFVHLKQFAPLLDNYPEIQYYQAVVDRQEDRDRMTIYLEGVGDGFPLTTLQQKLRDTIRVTPELSVSLPNSLPRNEPQLVDKRTWE